MSTYTLFHLVLRAQGYNPGQNYVGHLYAEYHNNVIVMTVHILINIIYSLFLQEKSKYDWDTFKKDEGIEEELKNFNKDGYGHIHFTSYLTLSLSS